MVNKLPPLAGPVDASGEPERKRVSDVLTKHWIVELRCNHDLKTDQAFCACATWKGPELLSVGSAVRAWADHVADELAAAASLPSPPAQEPTVTTSTGVMLTVERYNELMDAENEIGKSAIATIALWCRRWREQKDRADAAELRLAALPPSSPVADNKNEWNCNECGHTVLVATGAEFFDCVRCGSGTFTKVSAPSPSAGAKKE